MVVGIGTLALAASGSIASGAIRVGPEENLADNWIQVSGVSQAVSFDSLQPINVGDSAGGEETEGSEGIGGESDSDDEAGSESDSDSGAGGGGGDDGDNSLTSQLEVVVDPTEDNIVDPSSAQLTDETLVPWAGSIHETSLTRSTENGLLSGIKYDRINKNAVTQYGTFSSTVPGGDVVFIIANGGSGENDVSLPAVDVLMRLYSNNSPDPIDSDQLQFPYRVLDSDRRVTISGDDLSDPRVSVSLATGEVIEVIVEFDTTEGDGDFNTNFSEIRFFANGEDD